MKEISIRKPISQWFVVFLILSNVFLILYLSAELYYIVKPENDILRNELQIQKSVVNFLVNSSFNNIENLDFVIKNTKFKNLQGEEISLHNELKQNTFMFFVPKDVCPTCYDLSFLKKFNEISNIVVIVPINMVFDLRETLEFYKIYPKYFVYKELFKDEGISTEFSDPCLFLWRIKNAKSEKILFVPKQFSEELIDYYFYSLESNKDTFNDSNEFETP